MPVNRNALIRYKTIDQCLQNRYRQWTLDDLIEACSEALYEYEGITKGISKRTVQLDIQMMRSDKLGYNAPIIVYDNKYYTYEEKGYSITNIPLTDKDLAKMAEAVEFMKQFKGFSHFRELDGMIQKLEDHVYSQKKKQKPAIDFEKNENLKGLEFLDILYQSIIQQRAVKMTYQSFKARQSNTFIFHPYLLKEYRNRWYILGVTKRNEPVITLALDRILSIIPSDLTYIVPENFNAESYFKDVIGVTVEENQKPERIVLYVAHKHANYVITKPLHSSQKVIDRDDHGITIELMVQHNFELEKEILGMGEGMQVLAPEGLKRSINSRLNDAVDLYTTSINEKGIDIIRKKLENKGFAVVNHLYTKRILRQIASIIYNECKKADRDNVHKTIEPDENPKYISFLINRNMEKISNQLFQDVAMSEVIFYQRMPAEMFSWQQSGEDVKFSLICFLEHSRIPSYPIQVIPGSHKKKLDPAEQTLIIENSSPSEIELYAGAGILLKPMLIRRFQEDLKNRKVQFLELKFKSTF